MSDGAPAAAPVPSNPLARAIAARGFRKWYEGRLIESHLHLVAMFLCMIAVVAAIEQGGPYNALAPALLIFALCLSFGALGVWCLHRYFSILKAAEFLGGRSHCPQCDAYGRFDILRTGPRDNPDGALDPGIAALPRLFVRCRKCATPWTM
jgi:hypothetical protein